MAITIQAIETKEFKVRPNGYDPEEVDVFLDSIIDEFEDMQREIQSLRAAAARPQRIESSSAHTEGSEAAQKLLVNAQRVSDETISDARKQADLLIADAKSKADQLLADARKQAESLQGNLDTLRSTASDYRARFIQLLDEQAKLISAENEIFS